ncbi:MAG: GGDEF domain-containing protein [Lachnospiraceae bacterium]|nr:GGDEF domain-containing protein [Lachnospiraceae bacterium]
MKIEHKECIEKLIEELSMNRKDTKKCFFKHYSSFELYENEIQALLQKYPAEYDFVFYEFAGTIMQDAYCPFLNLIRDLYYKHYADTDISQILKECGVYPLQRVLFENYIRHGVCRREEDIIPREVGYEHERFIQSVCNILEYMTQSHKLVLILNKLHLAQMSTLRLLRELVWHRDIQNVVLVGTYNESFNVSTYMLKDWLKFKEKLDGSDYIVKCDDEEESGTNNDITAGFEPDISEIHTYIKKINDMIYTLAFREADYYLEIIYHSIEINKMDVEKKTRIRILLMYAAVAVYNRQSKHAYVLCKKVQDSDYLYQDIDSQYNYYCVLALVLLYSGQRNQALSAVENARAMARSMDNKEKMIQIDMLDILVLLNGCQDTFVWDVSMEIPKAILNVAEQNNQKNHLAYAYLFGYIDMETMKSDHSDYFIKGIQIAKEIDNIELQLLAWQKNAVVASASGRFEDIIRYYNKCMEIIEGLERPWDEIQIYNGVGYSCILNEKYDMANDYFKKALQISLEMENSMMIIEAIYNMSVNGIAMGDYEAVVHYITTELKAMEILRIERIRTCNKSKLYGMLIFAYIKLEMLYDAKLYFDKMKTTLTPFLEDESMNCDGWEDDIFLFYLVRGMLYKADGHYREANDSYVQGRFIWNKARSKQEYVYARFVEEEAGIHELFGEEEKRKNILENGIVFCTKNKLLNNAERLRCLLENKPLKQEEYRSALTEKDLQLVMKAISVSGLKQELKNRNKMLDFFESWVEVLNQTCESVEELIYDSLNMLQNNFNIDNLIYIDVVNENPVIRFKDKNMDFNPVQARFLLDYMKRNRKKIIVSRFEKSFSIHEELISIFAKNSIASMIVIPFLKNDKISGIFVTISGRYANFTENVNVFSEEDANAFRTAFRELLEAVNREEIKKQLKCSSITDTLTGLNNRQGLKQYFEKQFNTPEEFIIRPEEKQFTILYMDLDNFKYCNDHFGHDAGDAVIVAFSRLLETSVSKEDCVVRYGGDEFLIILNNRTEDYGVHIAQKILESVDKNRGFKSTIEAVYEKEVDIPKVHQISCSIGIAAGKTGSFSGISKILKHADEALYHVKKSTKHDYFVWRKTN